MGAYLSTPVRDKESRDFEGDLLSFGASSMQGWRMTQEDAHCCQVDFDVEKKTSLFAVFDGHGGAEVAQYSAMNFPGYLKKTSQYAKGLIKDALEEAFLGFDATLTEESVIKQLKDLAGVENEMDEVDEEVKNEAAALCEEASMPLEKVLERYGGPGSASSLVSKSVYSLRKRQKFQSPVVRTKAERSDAKEPASDSDAAGSDGTEASNESPASSHNAELDEVKAKLEDKLVNGFCEKEAKEANRCQVEVIDSPGNCSVPDEEVSTSGHKVPVPESTSGAAPNAESNSASVVATENGTETCNSGNQAEKRPDEAPVAGASCAPSGEGGSSSEMTSSGVEREVAGPSIPSSSSSGVVADDEEDNSEEDTEEEEQDSEDEDDKWNSEEGEDDSDDDDDVDGFHFEEDEDDDDDDDDDEEEEDGAMNTMGWNEEPGADSGCTAVVALLKGRTLYVANAGDSRCIFCRDGVAVEMSADHKPEDTLEQERIVKAGGKVTCDGRVNGGLNLSRALGDHSYKQNTSLCARRQMITALPDVRSITLTENDRFMVLACDGIWNVMSSQDVVDFVQKRLDSGVTKLSTICEEMFEVCLAPDTTGDGTGCDNMTCVIVLFNKLHTDEDIETTKKRKADGDTDDSSTAKRSREDDADDISKDL